MIVGIHQPHFLPWLGYLHRMAQVDAFVLLDHVQFERRNYQNRTMIRMNDEARWLTVPVMQRSQKERIVDKEVDNRLEGPQVVVVGALPHPAPRLSRGCVLRHLRRAAAPAVRDALRAAGRPEPGRARPAARGLRHPHPAAEELRARRRGRARRPDPEHLPRGRRRYAAGGLRRLARLPRHRRVRARQRAASRSTSSPTRSMPQCGAAPFLRGLSAIDMLLNCGPRSAELLLPDRALARAA